MRDKRNFRCGRSYLLYCCMFFLSFNFFVSVFASELGDVVITSTGIGDITAGSEGKARDAAIEDALRKAVEQTVGTLIQSETVVQNFTLVSDKILSRSSGYVKKYDIVNESKDESTYKVTVLAVISSERIIDDLKAIGLLMFRKHRPRIMVVIPERNLGRRVYNPVAETEIIKGLLARGFKVVDQSQVAKIRYGEQVKAAVEGDMRLARKIGSQHSAEIIIVGEAFSEPLGNSIAGMISARGRIDARAIKTDTGEIIAAESKDSTGIDVTGTISGKSAIQKASVNLTDSMVEQIFTKWNDEVNNISSVEFVVNGVTHSQLTKLNSILLTSFRGVKGVHQRSFTGGRAAIEVELSGQFQSFIDELVNKNFKDFSIEITDTSVNRIEAKLIDKLKK